MNIITVEDMYNKSVESGSKLFPLLNLDFWNDYSENSEIFDRRFCNLYSSFFYYAQRENDTVESVLQKFKDYVGDFLYFNSKKYSELYRINNISDTAYSITDNYSTTETLEKENTNTSNLDILRYEISKSVKFSNNIILDIFLHFIVIFIKFIIRQT